VATLVWEYRNTPDTYGGFMGDTQRRAGGGTLVCWGGTFASPNLTDLHADGSKGLELAFDASQHIWWSYRAFRFPWRTTRFVTEPPALDFGAVGEGSPATLPVTVRNPSANPVTITCVLSTDPAYGVTTALPVTLAPGGSAALAVRFAPPDAAPHPATLYVRQVTANELVAQSVTLQGTGVGPTDVTLAGDLRFGLQAARPTPFERSTVIGFVLPREGPVRLEILDVRGREVARLVDGTRPAGPNQARWTPGRLPSGMYFCRLEAGGRVATRKLVLTR
ncbi:MAG TPA: T9SS type A sorting domain-containing protein, partial [Candidatus Eisenbacteria bacterium]